jgi:cysteine desulfurase
MSAPVYLDHNATSPLRPEAAAAMRAAMDAAGNASSVHGFGRRARKGVEDARETIAAALGAAPADLVFTSGGTEANALAIAGTGRARVLVSAIEHDSVRAAAPAADAIPVTRAGQVDLAALDGMLRADAAPALVCVMAANNETGAVQPVAEIVRRARAAGALVHVDAVQALGKIAFDVAALGVDYASVSAHKIGGPAGIGALYVRPGAPLAPLIRGGGQERGRRAGTENVVGIAGFAGAVSAIGSEAHRRHWARLAEWTARLGAEMTRRAPDAIVFGRDGPHLANTLCVALPGLTAETQVMALDLVGIAVSAGAACSSGKVRPSHVLAAMGAGREEAASAIRISLGWTTTEDDVARGLAAWLALAAGRKGKRAA